MTDQTLPPQGTPSSLASYPLLPLAGLSFLGGLIVYELFEANIYTKWASWGLGVTLPALCAALFGANLSADEHNVKLKIINDIAQKKFGLKDHLDLPPNTSTVAPVKGIVGFVNPGNGCYANTAMQMLSCMRKEIEAVKTSNPLQERLRRALLNAFEERDFQAAKGNNKAKPVAFRHVQLALDALTVFRAKSAGLPVSFYPTPFNSHTQQCAAEVVEMVAAELGIVEWQINPFLRYKELREDNQQPRYSFAEYGKYFSETEADAKEIKSLRAALQRLHEEHIDQGVSSRTIGDFLQITTQLAQQEKENDLFNVFATRAELPLAINKWNISQHLLYAFWKCKLWDHPNPQDQGCDPLPNTTTKNETPYEFLKHHTIGSYGEKTLLKEENTSQQQVIKKLLQIAELKQQGDRDQLGENGKKIIDKEVLDLKHWQVKDQKNFNNLWKEFEGLTNQIAESLKQQNSQDLNKFINNDDVQMDSDPTQWLVGQRMAFAYWHIGKFHPQLTKVRNPIGDLKGAASILRLRPIHTNTSGINSIQGMIDQKSLLKKDWEVSAHFGLTPPKFLPIYFSRFELSEPVAEEKKEEESSRVFNNLSHLLRVNQSESEKTEPKTVCPRVNSRKDYKVKPEAEISIQVGDKQHVYTLDAIGVHSGSSTSGHYYGYIKTGNQWVEVNDSSSTPKSWEQVQQEVLTRAYVFLYRQKDN